jgi:hypothetical protein
VPKKINLPKVLNPLFTFLGKGGKLPQNPRKSRVFLALREGLRYIAVAKMVMDIEAEKLLYIGFYLLSSAITLSFPKFFQFSQL